MGRRPAGHSFGGRHTADKLGRLTGYMSAYTTALKNKGFTLVYIDAFAGSGERTETRAALPLFDSPEEFLSTPGSAKIAIDVVPPFEVLSFIERDTGRFAELCKLKDANPLRKISVHNGDANRAVQALCRDLPWHGSTNIPKGMRGLLFLDPYGMEVDWTTIEAVAATEAIDMWCFFPLMGLFRQAATRAPNIDAAKRARLNAVLGTDEWFTRWYQPQNGGAGLFDDTPEFIRTADVNAIEEYVRERLAKVFKGPVLKPKRIYSGHAPLASLFFAVSNPSPQAIGLATKIASHILKDGISSKVRP
jgi:three-Cys-motif partner protein